MKKLITKVIFIVAVLVVLPMGIFANGQEEDMNEAGNGEKVMVEKYPDIMFGPAPGKKASDYKFGFSFGGIASYADPCPEMANLAAQELGIVEIKVQTPQNWIQNEQNQKLDGLIASGMKGIFMMTSEPTAGNAQITKMVNAGIPIVTMGGPPELPSKSTLTLATVAEQAAYDGTVALIKAMGEKGNVVALIPMINDTNTQKRLNGIKKAISEYSDVTLLQSIADMENVENAMTQLGDLLAARSDEIDGIMAAGYTSATVCATFMMKPEYSHIKSVGFDTDEKVMEAIAAGKMTGTMSQNPWGQAYISMYTLKMLVDGWEYKEGQPEVINSGSFLITKDNIGDYENMIKEETFKLMATWTDRFTPPANY